MNSLYVNGVNRLTLKFKAKLEIGQNLKQTLGVEQCPRISTSEDIAAAFETIVDSSQEIMIVGAIDCKCRLIHWSVIAIGSNERMTVRIGDAFLGASQNSASGIFLIHNHPSGSLEPSKEDFAFTNSVAEAGIILGYPLLDHVIISSAGFRSLLTQTALKHPRNRVPLTVAYVCDSSADTDIKLRWNCPHCKKKNMGRWQDGVQNHNSGMSRPVRCATCSGLTWLNGNRK